MRTELFPGGIAPSDHEMAINRLESFGRELKSPNPPARFNPLHVKGIEFLRVAASNLEVQQGINNSIGIVQRRLEESLRFMALQSIEQHDPEPKVFDSFSTADLSQLIFFYGAFHQNIGRVLGSDVIPIEDVKTLAQKHEEAIPKVPPSRAIVTQRREAVIDKLQDWLVDPNIDQKMEQLLPVDNEGDDVWLFMDSIRTLNGQLGLKHGVSIKDFFRRNLDDLGKHTYNVDFSKRGNGVVLSGNNAPVDEIRRPNVEEAESSEPEPFTGGTIIFQTTSTEIVQIVGEVPSEPVATENTTSQSAPELSAVNSDKVEKKRQAEEKTRQELEKIMEELGGITGFSLDNSYNYGQVRNMIPSLRGGKIQDLTRYLAGRKSDKDKSEVLSGEMVISLVWLNQHLEVPAKIKKTISKIVKNILDDNS